MNIIRQKVSRSRKRFVDEEYNLDLTYITPQIIATSYPSTGIEASYRNPAAEVSRFFNTKHAGKYWIFNVAERATYDKQEFFEGRVTDYAWPDHHAPPLHFLFQIAQQASQWLTAEQGNIIAVHCNSGKGRTGSVICCILLYTGFFNCIDDCLLFYSHMRGVAVGQPCQLRYVYYFEAVLRKKIKSPAARLLREIRLGGAAGLQGVAKS